MMATGSKDEDQMRSRAASRQGAEHGRSGGGARSHERKTREDREREKGGLNGLQMRLRKL